MSTVHLQSHQGIIIYVYVPFILLLLSTGIGYLLIVSNVPEDNGYAGGCWKVEINNLFIDLFQLPT